MCAVRNDILGGSDYVGGEVIEAVDANDTNNEIISKNKAMVGVAQTAFQIVEATTFNNQDNLAADLMSDTTGKNDTINTGSTTMVHFAGSLKQAYTNIASSNIETDVSTMTNASAAFDTDVNSYANSPANGTYYCGKTWSTSTLIDTIFISASVSCGAAFSGSAWLESYDGSTWTVELSMLSWSGGAGGASYTNFYRLNKSVKGLRIGITGASGSSVNERIYCLCFASETTKKILKTGNLLTLDGTEKFCIVYSRVAKPSTETVTVDITDGSTTLTDQPINTPVDISSLSSGNLALTFNVTGTNNKSPIILYGYGVYISK